MKHYKNLIQISIIGFVFTAMTLFSWFSPVKTYSDSERRKLAQSPALSLKNVFDGTFMKAYDTYTTDQFPFRDTLRTLKALTSTSILKQKDVHGIYLQDGYAAKLEYPLNEASLEYATKRFTSIYNTYLANTNNNIYLSIIPDKSYFLAEENGYPALDYERLFSIVQNNMNYATYIDITDTLDISKYYKTDSHWRQEKLTDTASVLAKGMDVSISGNYQTNTLDIPFNGVYYGQSALPLPSETIYYLTSDILNTCIVTNYEDSSVKDIYNMQKAYGKDPYEMFLSGPVSLITIENPQCTTDKELVIFRDSFASSIAPLLAEGYSKITLVDIRYLRSDFLGKFLLFDDQDVLFLYSTSVLNHSETLS